MRIVAVGLSFVGVLLAFAAAAFSIGRRRGDALIDGEIARRGYRYRAGMESVDYALQARGARMREIEESKVRDARRRAERVRTSSGHRAEFPRAVGQEDA